MTSVELLDGCKNAIGFGGLDTKVGVGRADTVGDLLLLGTGTSLLSLCKC